MNSQYIQHHKTNCSNYVSDEMSDELLVHTSPAARLLFDSKYSGGLITSRLCGYPHLKSLDQWPQKNGRLHQFLGQLLVSEIPDIGIRMPTDGMLSFFIDDYDDFEIKIVFQNTIDLDKCGIVEFPDDGIWHGNNLKKTDYKSNSINVKFDVMPTLKLGYNSPIANMDGDAYCDFVLKYRNALDDKACLGYVGGHTDSFNYDDPKVLVMKQFSVPYIEIFQLLCLKSSWDIQLSFADFGTLNIAMPIADIGRVDFNRMGYCVQ